MKNQSEKMAVLLSLLKSTKEVEIDCDEFWDKGPSLAENVLDLNADEFKSFLHHLEVCPGCHENFEILRDILNETKA